MYDIIFKVKQEKSRTQKVRIFNIHAHALTRTAILTHLPPPILNPTRLNTMASEQLECAPPRAPPSLPLHRVAQSRLRGRRRGWLVV